MISSDFYLISWKGVRDFRSDLPLVTGNPIFKREYMLQMFRRVKNHF